MKKLFPYVAGFIGGMAFLISCGGGSSTPTVASDRLINEAVADTTVKDQMYCTIEPYDKDGNLLTNDESSLYLFSSIKFRVANVTGGLPLRDAYFACVTTNNETRIGLTLGDLISQQWVLSKVIQVTSASSSKVFYFVK